MRASESIQALRRANPRARAGFAESVDAATRAVQAQVVAPGSSAMQPRAARRPGLRVSAFGAAVAAAAGAVILVMLVSPGGGPGVENAKAAVKKAASVTAASANRSGTAVVRITHGGEPWAGTTIRWNGGDVVIARDAPQRPGKAGDELRLVDGMLYGPSPEGGWVVLGKPSSIDPDSGTTPAEYLAAVREDIGGVTLRRITAAMTGLTSRRLEDGSSVYSGTVASGVIARETGFKEGQAIRVLPFGYVAHDEAADAGSPLRTAVTVGRDGVVRELAVTWGTGASVWRYTVTYSGLGSTAGSVAPPNARPLRELWPIAPNRRSGG
jgi:hypothetical protein